MKHWKLVLLGCLVLGLAVSAFADYNVLDKNTYKQNATSGAKTDAFGNAYIIDSNPNRDANLTFQSVISNTSLAFGAADSNATPLDTHAMRLGMLLFKGVVVSGDSNDVVRIAVQVRTHLNGNTDSLSTFAIYQYGVSPSLNQTSGVTPDTASVGQLWKSGTTTAVSATPTNSQPYSGEFVVSFRADRMAHATGSVALPQGREFYYPNGIAIPMNSLFGREIYSPSTTIRVRNIGTRPGAANRAINITVHLVGTPL